jgi:hypothetical protein
MKFAHYLTTLEHDAPKEWQGKFLKYVECLNMVSSYSSVKMVILKAGWSESHRDLWYHLFKQVFRSNPHIC